MQRHLGIALKRGLKRALEAAVHLESVHSPRDRGQSGREHAQARADLQHHIVRPALELSQDDAQDVVVYEKVLAQVALRYYAELLDARQRDLLQAGGGRAARPRDFALSAGAPSRATGLRPSLGLQERPFSAANRGNARCAFASTCAANSSTVTPRSPATHS